MEEENSTALPENKIRLRTVIGAFFLWFILAVLVWVFLGPYMIQVVVRGLLSPQETMDFLEAAYKIRIANSLSTPLLVGTFLVGTILTYLISRSVQFSRILLALIAVAAVGLTVYTRWVVSVAEGLGGAIAAGLILLIAQTSWIIAAGAFPILVATLSKQSGNLLTSRKFWATGILMLIGILVAQYFIASPGIAESLRVEQSGEKEIQNFYNNPEFPIYEPSYLPLGVEGVLSEIAGRDAFGGLFYRREYHSDSSSRVYLIIEVTKLKDPKTDEVFFQENLEFREGFKQKAIELRESGIPRWENVFIAEVESMTIGQNPVLYYTESTGGTVLEVYRDGVQIRIDTAYGSALPKEELIKIAESLQRIDN
ncbi:DUF4367 domain-containing protein [Patescibacteria group bacterium]|nr:DUF4367 domain-containing protein [Patescibacteria group bacterium]